MSKTKLNLGAIDDDEKMKIEEITNDAPLKQMNTNHERPKTVNISITIWPQDLALLDQLAAEMGVGRSAMIRILLRQHNSSK